MLIRHDPFRDVERLAGSLLRGQGAARSAAVPLRAVRSADGVVVSFDLPGVAADDIELTVDRNVLGVRATRADHDPAGAEVLIDERGPARLEREVTLSESLDAGGISASYADGVLEVRIPLSREATARRVQVQAQGGGRPSPVGAGGAGPGGSAGSAAGDEPQGHGTAPPAQPPPPAEQANPAPTS